MPKPCHNRWSSKPNFFSFKYFMADEPVSRILCGAALASQLRDDHSSSPGLATGIQRPTRGFILSCNLRCTRGSAFCQTHSASWASSPLLFGLAPRGVCRAGVIADTAVGSSPPFHPYLRGAPLEDIPKVFLRAITGIRSAGGIFSVALSVNSSTGFSPCSGHRLKSVLPLPWRYQARCPTPLSRSGVRTFLPPSCLRNRASDHPAHPPFSLYPSLPWRAELRAAPFRVR